MVSKTLTKFLALMLALSPILSNAQEFKTKDGKPDLSINNVTHDFGKIPQGEPASHSFTIQNTGDAPLVIKDVEPSCGCTTPKWPKKPISPGDSAEIKAVYDAESMGAFQKSIHVKTNVPFSGNKTLKIKGVVQKSDQEG
jgi:hypothetical protein